jgi:hypothetical protein
MSLPTTVPDVVARLTEIDDELAADDGVAVFNRVYLTVTERVAALLEQGGGFVDDAFMADLDVRFARLWLLAYDAAQAGEAVPRASRPLFESRHRPGILPIQHALAGMNAHIEHDLPLAMVSTCQARGASLLERDVRADYLAVNQVLASVESEIRRSFLDEVSQAVDDRLAPVAHLVSAWNIETAREVAWTSAETLWSLRRTTLLRDRFLEALAHTVGMGSRVLLTPVLRGRGGQPA